MMSITTFIGIIASLQLVCFFAGKQASKQVLGQQDYFLAEKISVFSHCS